VVDAATGAVPSAPPLATVANGVNVGMGVTVGAGVFVGAAKAVAVKSDENVATASVRIWSGRAVRVACNSAGIPPHALSNKAPIINICTPTINRNLSILSPFHKRRYFTWNLIFVQLVSDEDYTNLPFLSVL
jgi:hypothetical protein